MPVWSAKNSALIYRIDREATSLVRAIAFGLALGLLRHDELETLLPSGGSNVLLLEVRQRAPLFRLQATSRRLTPRSFRISSNL